MERERREHVLAGLVGAFLGSLIGVACIVGVGQLGYVASISGVVMAVCAIKGYALLGGTISRKGAVISCVLTVIMTYFGNRLDFAVSVARLAEVDVFSAFQAMGQLLDGGYINAAAYWGNLVMLYLFTLLGAVPTLMAAFRRATPVSIPQEHTPDPSSPETANEPSLQVYPFAGLSWTLRLRLSLCLPIFLPILLIVAFLLGLYSRYGDDLNASVPIISALLGATIGMIVSCVWMLSRLYALQSMQFVFVRTGGELWRVDLAKLNRIEPYRFTTKTGAVRVLRWDILTEEEQQRARSAIQRAIHSIRAGEIMPDSILRQFVLYLPDPRLEKETKWVWRISYALNTQPGGRRKNMTISKVYRGLVPAPGATAQEGPLPARWGALILPLAITVLLGLAGWGVGLSLSGGGQPSSISKNPSIGAVRPESVVYYEQNGVRFLIDSTFQDLDGAGQFMDPATGTVYLIGVQPGADQETALDVLLGPIGDARMLDTFKDIAFAYPYEEKDLVELEAEDGAVYQHNLLTIHFTDGQAFHSAVSLSDSGTLIQIMAVQDSGDDEEQVRGMIRYLLTTLTASKASGQEHVSV